MVDVLNTNFEPLAFCCVLFVSSILVSVNVIDIHTCKVLIGVKCVTFVSEIFTRYGSNITINECMAINFYANDFSILLRSIAQKIIKIRQYL